MTKQQNYPVILLHKNENNENRIRLLKINKNLLPDFKYLCRVEYQPPDNCFLKTTQTSETLESNTFAHSNSGVGAS